MQIYIFYCYVLVTFVSQIEVYSKSITYDNRLIRNDAKSNAYPVKRKIAITDEPYYMAPREKQSDLEYSDTFETQPASRFHRRAQKTSYNFNNLQEHEPFYQQLDTKRGIFRQNMLNRRSLKHEDVYGIVYGNGRPLGILQPYPQAYEFSPLQAQQQEGIEEIQESQSAPTRSDKIVRNYRTNNEAVDSAQYVDESYPTILTNFKIDSRLNEVSTHKREDNAETQEQTISDLANSQDTTIFKRDALITNPSADTKKNVLQVIDNQISQLRTTLNQIQNPGPSDRLEEIEENLRGILDDMGLIETKEDEGGAESLDKSKRDTNNEEDENLEEGVNKIELIKAVHEEGEGDRSKREDKKDGGVDDSVKTQHVVDVQLKGENQKTSNTDKSITDHVKNEEKSESTKVNVANYQKAGEAFLRNKRQETKSDNSDLMKGLEKSGDLTVSGNKSPLASSGNEKEMQTRSNDQATTSILSSERTKRENNELDLENSIRSKINAIKEQVKREIASLKAQNQAISDDEENDKEPQQRQKKDAMNTLLEEEEASRLNPEDHPDEKLEKLTRSKRELQNFEYEDDMESENGNYRGIREANDEIKDSNVDSESSLGAALSENNENPKPDVSTTEVFISDSSTQTLIDEQKINQNSQHIDKQESDETLENPSTAPNQLELNENSNSNQKQSLTPENTNLQIKGKNLHETNVKAEVNLKSDEQQEMNKEDDGLREQQSQLDFNLNEKEESKRKAEDNVEKFKQISIESQAGIEESNKRNPLLRRRRQVAQPTYLYLRENRDNAFPYSNLGYVPYRAEDEESDDDGGEFDDYGLDDRTANVQKRENNYDSEGDYSQVEGKSNQKRPLSQKYVANMNTDVYENPPTSFSNNFLYESQTPIRKKRYDFEQVAAVHGGGPMLHHLAAIKERNMQQLDPDDSSNNKQIYEGPQTGNFKKRAQNIADFPDTDIFGALGQSYQEELSRFKRVKRN